MYWNPMFIRGRDIQGRSVGMTSFFRSKEVRSPCDLQGSAVAVRPLCMGHLHEVCHQLFVHQFGMRNILQIEINATCITWIH